MKAYFLENSLLEELIDTPGCPEAGDVVVYMRVFQDLRKTAKKKLTERGVRVFYAEDLLSFDDIQELDAFNDNYIQNWFRLSNADISLGGGFSLGEILGYIYSKNYGTGQIIRFGEVCRRVLDQHDDWDSLVTDVRDGAAVFIDHQHDQIRLLRLSVLREIAQSRNLSLDILEVSRPIPNYHLGENENSILNIFRRLAGGLRWIYLRERLILYMSKKKNAAPRIYIFMNHGIRRVANALYNRDDVEVFADIAGHSKVPSIRFDHFIGFPRWDTIVAAGRLILHVARRWDGKTGANTFIYKGVDYTHLLQRTARSVVYRLMPSVLFKLGQILKFLQWLQPDAIVINGESSVQVRALISESARVGYKTFFFRHGYTTYRSHFYPTGHNNPHVTYIANGLDHVIEYGTHLPNYKKPNIVVLSNPATAEMEELRQRLPSHIGKKVLVINFTASFGQTAARSCRYDDYTFGILDAANALADEGYHFTFRPHHGDNIDYLKFAFDQMNIQKNVSIESVGTFENALVAHDIVLVNVSSCHYQALYAGRPTIFYEPDYDARNFIGLPADTEIGVPIAANPDQLKLMIRQASDPASDVSYFPDRFANEFADRFIGTTPGNAASVLSDFIANGVR